MNIQPQQDLDLFEQCLDMPALSLLMVVFHFPPAATAGVHRSLRFTKYLGEFGCQPTVLTRNSVPEQGGEDLLSQVPANVVVHRVGNPEKKPHFNQSNQADGISANGEARENRIWESVKTILRPPWELVSETPDQHIGWARLASQHAIELCKAGPFEAIYTTGPPHSTHLVGMRVHRMLGLPWIADFRDPWARHNWTKPRNPWGRRLLPYYERKVIRYATRVILNNEASRDEFRRAYPEFCAEKFVAIPNGFDPDLQQTVAELQRRSLDARASNPKSKRIPVLCHPGSLYRQRKPHSILEAIQRLRQEGLDVKFQQIGDATEENDPLEIGAELGIEDLVEVLPKVSHHEVFKHMSQADILLVIQPNAPLQVPGKLYEMLLFDKPIVGVCDSKATSAVLDFAGHAWPAASKDVAAIAAAIRNALDSDDIAGSDSRREARAYFDGRGLSGQLREVFASVFTNHYEPVN